MWHPNIDKEGKVCISILHEPGGSEQPTKLNSPQVSFLKTIRPQGMIGSAMRRLVRGGCPSTLSRPFSSQVS